ncbi:reverse transcriptase domain-containing protein [Tanacetum coccineum]
MSGIEDRHHGPTNAMHNPSQPFKFISKDSLTNGNPSSVIIQQNHAHLSSLLSYLEWNLDLGMALEYGRTLLASLDVSVLDKPHFNLENLLRRFIHELNLDDADRDNLIRSLGMKIEIPEFTSKVHPDDFIDWLRKSKVETWEKMKKLMKAKFLTENHRQEAFLDYHTLSQHNMTMKEVINEFDKLRMRYDVVEEEEQVVAQFLGVLKLKIADIAKSKGFTSRFTPPTRTVPPTAPKIVPKTTTPTTSASGNTRERVDNAPRCYKCGGLGHYACDCPNLKTLTFVPDDVGPIYDTNAEPKLDEAGDELVYPNRGEALVIQRVLNVAVSKSVADCWEL